jgi:hypothetical protein
MEKLQNETAMYTRLHHITEFTKKYSIENIKIDYTRHLKKIKLALYLQNK